MLPTKLSLCGKGGILGHLIRTRFQSGPICSQQVGQLIRTVRWKKSQSIGRLLAMRRNVRTNQWPSDCLTLLYDGTPSLKPRGLYNDGCGTHQVGQIWLAD